MGSTAFFEGIWNVSIQFVGIVLIIFLVRAMFSFFRVPKKFAYFLWLIPFIRLLFPFNVESAVSIWPGGIVQMQEQTVSKMSGIYKTGLQETGNSVEKSGQMEKISEGIRMTGQKKTTAGEKGAGDTDAQGAWEETTSGKSESSTGVETDIKTGVSVKTDAKTDVSVKADRSSETVRDGRNQMSKKSGGVFFAVTGLFCLWGIGFLALFCINLTGYFRLKKRLSVSVPVEEGVYKADHIQTAFVLGFMHPVIYLPHDITEEEYRYVVAHERVHIRRKDHLIKLFAFLLRSVYWWNPFVWIAWHFMERDMEMSCDEEVLKKFGEEHRKAYADALLNLTVLGSDMGFALCFAEDGPKGRIKNIMKYKKPVFAVAVIAALVAGVLFVGLLTTPSPKKENGGIAAEKKKSDAEAGEKKETAEAEKKLEEEPKAIKPGRYQFTYASGKKDETIYLQLYEDGSYSSVCGESQSKGVYNIEDIYVTLYDNNGIYEEYACFRGSGDGEKLVFDGDNGAQCFGFSYKDLEHGVFQYTGNEYKKWKEKNWRDLILKVNNALYYGTKETEIMGDSGAVEGQIRNSVKSGNKPKHNGESNFGCIGNSYTYDDGDGEVLVFLGDNEWHVFKQRNKLEKQSKTK